MKIPLTKEVCQAIHDQAFEYLKNHISTSHQDILVANNINDINIAASSKIWSLRHDGRYIATTLFGMAHNFFYKITQDTKNLAEGESKSYKADSFSKLLKVFDDKYVDEDPPSLYDSLLKFIEKLDLPQHQITFQKKILKQRGNNFARNEEKTDHDHQAVVETLINKLHNSCWHLYFYGYPAVGQEISEDIIQIVDLILYFTRKSSNSSRLLVTVHNTGNIDHYDYEGEVDFNSSTREVLVINLKTITSRKSQRQLNIKFFIDGAFNDIFEGQYLNYEARSGRIFSGSIILEQAREQHPVPRAYTINRHNTINSDELTEIQHIIPFFKDPSRCFRETSVKGIDRMYLHRQ